MLASILISSHNRIELFRRTLWSIANRPPSIPYEVIIVDDDSDEPILSEVQQYSSVFKYKFIRFNRVEFESKTGLKKFHNNPCVTNNIAFRHSNGDLIFQQGNEVIAWDKVYDQMIAEFEGLVFSTTYDLRKEYLNLLDIYGSNLRVEYVAESARWPLQSSAYRSDVTNYISLTSRETWEKIKGYDERYYGGISAEDSDFVRRCRCLGIKTKVSDAISLHQYHRGKTCYYSPPANIISREKWDEGVSINHAVYNSWDGTFHNRQKWEWGTYGIGEIITNI